MMSCPLCNHDGARQSWLGSTLYGEREFSYLECSFCHSLYCSPMPDEQALARMYGVEYATAVAADPAAGDDSKEPTRVVERLAEERTSLSSAAQAGDGALSRPAGDGLRAAGAF